ncbi:MAG: DNA polymerase III subunit alpha [Deltaproteobacteria bacterium]|nr:DNA polymerase III subunit alpha [Deltaproteobacteria bacterium]
MKHAEFVHLHVHTQFSLLDGAIRLGDLYKKAREFHMPAVAITDHGNMFGAVEFYRGALEAGLHPLIGCELYMAPGSRFDREEPGNYHLILLVKNQKGYENLSKLVTRANFEGFYYKPRIDFELLQECNEGLIALSACLHGEIPSAILESGVPRALEVADRYRSIFSNNRFFLELQDNGIADQVKVNEGLLEIADKLALPLVATNDCHYLTADDAMAHEVLLCIQTGKTMNASDRMRFSTNSFYFKSPQEMERSFAHVPGALKNTIAIAERCTLDFKFNQYKFPHYEHPTGEDNAALFVRMSREGLQVRLDRLRQTHPDDFAAREDEYRQRLEDEIGMIKKMNFTTYFLIVSDFIRYAKQNGCPVGPGRGSAAGSLVAYCLEITEIDPIRYGLLFERFLNPERVSPPDIDVDFCMENRARVLDYVTQKYGRENVAQIITFGKMLAKGVIRDVGRALDMPYKEVDAIAKLVPGDLGMTIDKAIVQEPRLKERIDSDPQVADLIKISQSLEGLHRHASTHAAGVVIADKPLECYLPLYKGPRDEVLTQYSMNDVDAIGLIKFDFLGLRTLTVIEKAVLLIKADTAHHLPDMNDLPLDDAATYELLSSGEAEGIFQLESSGMKELLQRLKPGSIEDLTALIALYRPGPLGSGMVDDFIQCKHGHKQVAYPLPELEDVLRETYGIILYQEQVMQIARRLASFSLADADLLRRAMGKKKASEMTKQKSRFLSGAKDNKIDPGKAEMIFDLMAKFAEYGFNKSHSAAYAYIAFQTAYLKAHYPVEFMAALLSCEMDTTDKVVKHISECREKDIDVLPPDINASRQDFTVDGGKIRFGLAAVKNVGLGAIESILIARDSGGPFTCLADFCSRIDLRRVNKKVLESLIKCGACDCLGKNRAQLWAVLDEAVTMAQRRQKEKDTKQLSMFEMIAETTGQDEGFDIAYPDIGDWEQKERLAFEKECLGFYITGHPLDHYRQILRSCTNITTDGVAGATTERDVLIGGMVAGLKQITTKKGEPMAFVTFEDQAGTVEVIVFADVYRQARALLQSEQPLLIKGRLALESENNNRILAAEVHELDRAHELALPDVHVQCPVNRLNHDELDRLKRVLQSNPGKSKVFLHLIVPNSSETVIGLGDAFHTNASPLLVTEVESIMGKHSLSLR